MALEIRHSKSTAAKSTEEKESSAKSPVPPTVGPIWDPLGVNGIIADRTLYIAKDGRTVTDDLKGSSGTLLAAKGGNIDAATVERLGLELKGSKVEQKKVDEKDGVAPADPGTPNEGQIATGEPLVKVVRTGVLRPEPAVEHPKLHVEEEIKEQAAEEKEEERAEEEGAARKAAAKTGARKSGGKK